jgi:hypothetical protein
MKIAEIVNDPRQGMLDPTIIHPQQQPRQAIQPTQIWQTPEFQAWFKGSKVVDRQGRPLRVYHGTTTPEDFDEFAVGSHTAKEDDQFYRTGSGQDPRTFLGSHFAKEVHVAGKFARGLYGERQHSPNGGRIYPVYLRIVKPFVTTDSAMLDAMLGQEYNTSSVDWVLENESTDEQGNPINHDAVVDRYERDVRFRSGINQSALEFENDSEPSEFILAEEMAAMYRGKLIQRGYDGIIYKNEIEGGTSYIIFDPRQVKSAFNTGSFNPENPNMSENQKPRPRKIKHGNGGKRTIQYVDDVPDIANPVARSVLTQPHLRQRALPSKRVYNRKRLG